MIRRAVSTVILIHDERRSEPQRALPAAEEQEAFLKARPTISWGMSGAARAFRGPSRIPHQP